MTMTDTLVSFLSADATLVAILTGGIHGVGSTGRNGISEDSVAAAYDSTTHILKPCALVHVRSDNPWGGGHDSAAKYDSMRAVAEIYVYDDGDRTYTTIDSGCDRIEALLHCSYVSGAGTMKRINKMLELEDNHLNNAKYQQLDFQIVRGKTLT